MSQQTKRQNCLKILRKKASVNRYFRIDKKYRINTFNTFGESVNFKIPENKVMGMSKSCLLSSPIKRIVFWANDKYEKSLSNCLTGTSLINQQRKNETNIVPLFQDIGHVSVEKIYMGHVTWPLLHGGMFWPNFSVPDLKIPRRRYNVDFSIFPSPHDFCMISWFMPHFETVSFISASVTSSKVHH